MAKAGLKIRRYRSYGAADPFFVGREEATPAAHPRALSGKAYRALHLAMVLLPIVAGVDKFIFALADWSVYVAPFLPELLGTSAATVVYAAGAMELFLGIGIMMRPRIFADIFSAWVVAITANLLIQGEHFDVALFNVAIAAGACALARLSRATEMESADPLEPVEDRFAA